MTRTHVLVLSTADWDAPLWTNKQHLASRLATTLNVRVTYVESLGLRRVRPTLADARRLLGRAKPGPTPRGGPRGEVDVVTPTLVPLHSSAEVRRLTRPLLERTCRSWLEDDARKVL